MIKTRQAVEAALQSVTAAEDLRIAPMRAWFAAQLAGMGLVDAQIQVRYFTGGPDMGTHLLAVIPVRRGFLLDGEDMITLVGSDSSKNPAKPNYQLRVGIGPCPAEWLDVAVATPSTRLAVLLKSLLPTK